MTYRYRPLNESISAGCFVPHHAIIIFKNKRASYIDLCFHYVGYETSTDIKDLEIRDDKMKKLYAIFKEYGFTYEMDLEKK